MHITSSGRQPATVLSSRHKKDEAAVFTDVKISTMSDTYGPVGLNMSNEEDDIINLKMLIPSGVAGAIIGKGGEAIGQIQKETGARIRMTKLNDFYPGTSERVCLITGILEAVRKVIYFIMDKMKDKPVELTNSRMDDRVPGYERSRQLNRRSSTFSSSSSATTTSSCGGLDGYLMNLKILVPNTTAGRIIGKAGQYIEHIKEESGAYVQISQKSRETKLPERCVTIAGDILANRKAMDMILEKILEDPYSGNFPTISYADHPGPVANASPTGSPFATYNFNDRYNQRDSSSDSNNNFSECIYSDKTLTDSLTCSMSNLNLGRINYTTSPILDNLKMTLRNSGYSDRAAEEISTAYMTLSNYGHIPPLASLSYGPNMISINSPSTFCSSGLPSPNNTHNSSLTTPAPYVGSSLCRDGPGSEYGPIGSSNDLSPTSGTSDNDFYSLRDRLGLGSQTTGTYSSNGVGIPCGTLKGLDDSSYVGLNNNSFGLGVGLYGPSDKHSLPSKQDMEVPETIVGAILGPKGKGIVEIQQLTNATIQISKKGVYAPGTRNRLVHITGTPLSVAKAQFLIQHRLQQEEIKRNQQA